MSTAISRFTLLRSDPQFCLFVTVRSLLLCSALMGPFIVQLATQSQSSSIAVLGLFLVASSTSSILSAPIWGVFADRSSRNVMIIAALLTSALGLVLILITWLLPDSGASSMTYPVAFFILGIAHNGVRLGRKTYLVDMAKGNRRTDYVAVSNTVIGGLLLVIGTITALLGAISAELAIACLAAAGLCGSMLGTGLINVEKTS